MKPLTAVPLVIPADDTPPFRASINVVNSCLKKNKVRGYFYPVVHFIFMEILVWSFRNSTLLNSTFQLHRPNPSHNVFGCYPSKQDREERYWKQQFCCRERGISVQTTEITGPVKVDHFQRWTLISWSDQPKLACFNWIVTQNFQNFGLNGKLPRLQVPHLNVSGFSDRMLFFC